MRRPRSRRALLYLGAVLLAVWTLLPFYWLVSVSLMPAGERVDRPSHLYPHSLTPSAFLELLDPRAASPAAGSLGRVRLVRRGWENSLVVGVAVMVVTLAVGLPLGYALGRLRFRYRSALLLGLIVTRAYPPIAILIPLSAVFVAAGLQGSLIGLTVADLTLSIPLVTWCLCGLFGALPRNVEWAARVDGLTRWQTFWRVMVPIAAPGVAACAVIAFLLSWNEFTFSWILAAGSPAQTFPPTVAGAAATELAAVSVLALIPPAILALLVQRQIRRLHLVTVL